MKEEEEERKEKLKVFSNIIVLNREGRKNNKKKEYQDSTFRVDSIFENTLSCALGVFDGHGDDGRKVADFLSENFMGKNL